MSDNHEDIEINLGRRTWIKSTAAILVASALGSNFVGRSALAATGNLVADKSHRIGVVYFSKTGNTRFLAQEIARITKATLIEIRTVNPYPENYRATTRQARIEQDEDARPELQPHESLDNYDMLFIGYPNWWGTMPMAMFTLLEKNRLAGKTIMPFCTHQGSALGRSIRDMGRLCPDADILSGHAQEGGDLELVMSNRSVSSLHRWVERFDLPIEK